jgi:hypothetical protein
MEYQKKKKKYSSATRRSLAYLKEKLKQKL